MPDNGDPFYDRLLDLFPEGDNPPDLDPEPETEESNRISPWVLGEAGEKYAIGELVSRGIPTTRGGDADLLIHGDVPVEVKTAHRRKFLSGRRPGYQFRLREHRWKDDHPIPGEYFLFICWDYPSVDLDIYVIPKSAINGQQKITISGKPDEYKGKYSKWLNAWDQLIIRKDKSNGEKP
jgi:hypothetical protein